MDERLEQSVLYRDLEPGDVSFVLDSWIKSFRDSPYAGVIPNHRFFDITHEVIEELLARGAKVEVAAAKHDPTRILGWVCYEPVNGGLAVHYLYVKDPFRLRGLGKTLLERRDVTQENGSKFYTFRTRAAAYFPDWRHVPEIARRKSGGS